VHVLLPVQGLRDLVERERRILFEHGPDSLAPRRFIERDLLAETPPRRDPLAEGLLDSLAIEELLLFLEKRFGVSFRDEEMTQERFSSLDAVADLVEGKRRLARKR